MHFNPSTPNVWHGGRLLAPNWYERRMIDNSLSLSLWTLRYPSDFLSKAKRQNIFAPVLLVRRENYGNEIGMASVHRSMGSILRKCGISSMLSSHIMKDFVQCLFTVILSCKQFLDLSIFDRNITAKLSTNRYDKLIQPLVFWSFEPDVYMGIVDYEHLECYAVWLLSYYHRILIWAPIYQKHIEIRLQMLRNWYSH